MVFGAIGVALMSVLMMSRATRGDEEDGTTSTTPPSLNRAQAAPAWLYGGNTATPADTYSTGHPTPVTYS